MKLRYIMWLSLTVFCSWPLAVPAQLQIVPAPGPQNVFGGGLRTMTVVWHNAGNKAVEAQIHARLLQASSATVVQLSEMPWKNLQVLPGQTVIESANLDFPAVKAETKFLIQWLVSSNFVVGRTEVMVYPTNLLAELKLLAGDEALGVFDPLNQIKPLLKNLKLNFTDLENVDLENFAGRFAIIGPFQSKAQMRDGLSGQIQALAKKGAGIVWLQPPPVRRDKILPSFYLVLQSTNAVVIVQPELVADLPNNPQSQLNLIYFCKLALQPQPVALPNVSPQP